jgi:L-ascorbate metabolism protein UlaG (beta-lactamase superfamily)
MTSWIRRAIPVALSALLSLTATRAFADPKDSDDPPDHPDDKVACSATTLASTGGTLPHNRDLLVLRWTGYANFEMVYRGQILLLDTYFDRGSLYRPLGFKAADVNRATAILLGHAHYDHMSDAASVGSRLKVPVYGAPVTIAKLLTQSIDPSQLRSVTGKGGEVIHFDGFKVEPVLGQHSSGNSALTAAYTTAYNIGVPPPAAGSPDAIEQATIQARGSNDPKILTEGSISFIFTFDSGFRLAWRDTGGDMTTYEQVALAQEGPVDVLLGSIAPLAIARLQAAVLLPMVRLYHPLVYMPSHHDERVGQLLDRSTQPMFQAIKDEMPDVITIGREYREPVCFDTKHFRIKPFIPDSIRH